MTDPVPATPPPERTRQSGQRRWVFRLLGIALTVVTVELASCAGFWLVTGHSFSYDGVAREQTRQKAGTKRGVATAPTGGANRATGATANEGSPKDGTHPYLGYSTAHSMNPMGDVFFGQRGANTLRRGPDRLNIVLFGGSFADNVYLKGLTRFRKRLAAAPEFAGRKITVLNTATGGYKQPQQVIAFAYLLTLGAAIDIAINIDGFNEVALPIPAYGSKKVFPAYPSLWALRANETPSVDLTARVGKLAYLRAERRQRGDAFSEAPLRFSATAALTWALLDRLAARNVAQAEAAVSAYRPPKRNYSAMGPLRQFTSDIALSRELVAIWRRSSAKFDHLARTSGVLYLHFLQPNQYLAGSKPMGEEERRAVINPSHPFRPAAIRGYPLLRLAGATLAANDVAFTDLTQIFAGVTERMYDDDCCHVLQVGRDRVVDVIVEKLLAAWRARRAPK